MKPLLFVIILLYTRETLSKFIVNKIEGIEGEIESIQCFKEVCHVLAYTLTDYNWYKVDFSSQGIKVISQHKPFKDIVAMVVNNKHTVYLIAKVSMSVESKSQYFLWMKKNKWKNFSLIYKWTMNIKTELNVALNEDNYLLVTLDNGLVAFAKDKIVPVAIFSYLRRYRFQFFEVDPVKKTVYIKVEDLISNSDLVYIIKEDPKNKIPVAEIIFQVSGNHRRKKVTSIGITKENDVYFALKTSGHELPIAQIAEWDRESNKIKSIHSQLNSTFNFFCASEQRLYFTSEDHYIYFIQNIEREKKFLRNKVYGIKQVFKSLPIDKNICMDNIDASFLPFGNTILRIDKDKTDVKEMVTPSDQKISSIWLLRSKPFVWALGKELYYFSDENTKAVAVPDLHVDKNSKMIGFQSGKVVIGTMNGLSIVENES